MASSATTTQAEEVLTQIEQAATAQGTKSHVTLQDVEQLLSEGYTPAQIAKGTQAALGPQGQPQNPTGEFGQILNAVGQSLPAKMIDAVGNVVDPVAKNLAALGKTLTVGPETVLGSKLAAKPAPKKKTVKTDTTTQANTNALEQQIAGANLWNNLGQQLVGAQEKLVEPTINAVSGGLTAPAEASSNAEALSALGLSPNDSAAKWLASETKQADTNDAPLQQAMNAYGAAFAKGESGIESAIGGMGQANQLAIETAPEADWTTAIAQHVLSNVNYYGNISPATASTLPPSIWAALAASGGGGTPSQGAFPITDTPAQYEQAIKAYYAKNPAAGLPSSASAALGATNTGINGLPVGVSTAAPG